MIAYIENSKESTRKPPITISEFSKVEGYKINIEKSIVFLYFGSEHMHTEMKNKISLKITQKVEVLKFKSKKT